MSHTRPERLEEVYEVQCHRCHSTVEIATNRVINNRANCPRCGVRLEIHWESFDKTPEISRQADAGCASGPSDDVFPHPGSETRIERNVLEFA